MIHQTNEGIGDILSKIAQALNPVARAHNHGTKEIQNLTNQAVNKFVRYMGRNRQDWDSVTFNTLYKFLTIPDLFGLTAAEINEMVLDPDVKNKITSIVKGLPANYMTDYYAKPSKQIGGDPSATGVADRAQTIAIMILELSAIQHLDKLTGGSAIPDPTTAGGTATATATATPTGSATSGSTAGAAAPPLTRPTRQRSNDPTLDALYTAKYRVEMSMYVMQGGTP